MLRIILSGCGGKMGRAVGACVDADEDCEIIAGVDKADNFLFRFPVFSKFSDVKAKGDVIIDFSHPSVLNDLLDFARQTGMPIVLATTGFDEEQTKLIYAASREIPIFFSFNMSLGVNLLIHLAKKATELLGDTFDIEIVEKHHNQKLDAPSGTAIMLANAINETLGNNMKFEYDRHSKRQKRSKNEIGIHSVRGGTIVGEHDVIFAGHDEVVTLSHSAASKEVFAAGALKAAKFMKGKPAGLYCMDDMIEL